MKGMIGTGRIARGSLVTLAAALALTLAFAPARAATKTVPVPFATIEAAVLDASPGDTIIIKKGGGFGECTPGTGDE